MFVEIVYKKFKDSLGGTVNWNQKKKSGFKIIIKNHRTGLNANKNNFCIRFFEDTFCLVNFSILLSKKYKINLKTNLSRIKGKKKKINQQSSSKKELPKIIPVESIKEKRAKNKKKFKNKETANDTRL